MIPYRCLTKRFAGWFLLGVLVLGQASCLNLGDMDLSQAMKDSYPDPELQFLEAFTKAVEGSEVSEALGSDKLMRSVQISFTYPRAMFPEAYPDGVWAMELSNYTVPDKRLIRPPVGKEKRIGEVEGTVRSISVFARQRSETAQQLRAELLSTYESVHERSGRVEYQFTAIHAGGIFDDAAKKWVIDPKSIQLLGNSGQ